MRDFLRSTFCLFFFGFFNVYSWFTLTSSSIGESPSAGATVVDVDVDVDVLFVALLFGPLPNINEVAFSASAQATIPIMAENRPWQWQWHNR